MQALMLIDVQNAFLDSKWGKRNNPNAEQKMLRLLQHFRAKRQKIIHIQHISDNPNSLFYQGETQAFQAGFEPQNDEVVFQKKVNSAFIGTNLLDYLKSQGITELVVAGLTLPHCVSTTIRMAANYGFLVKLIENATASFPLKMPDGEEIDAEQIHKINIATLNEEFAVILSTDELIDCVESHNI